MQQKNDGRTETKETFVEKLTAWLMPDAQDPELADEARRCMTLDGVYSGRSARTHRLVRLAYLRGVRRGAGCAWEAQQPVRLREGAGQTTGCRHLLGEVRAFAKRHGARGAILMLFDSDTFSSASYGSTHSDCRSMGRVLDAIADKITEGTIAPPW